MVTARVTRWGNSLGIRIPKKKAMLEGIKEGDQVLIIKNGLTAGDLVRRFGIRKFKRSTQEMKDEARRGWGE